MALLHYIVVRRDLPLGVVLAQVAHAAGESFYLLGRRGGAVFLKDMPRAVEPDRFEAAETVAIVLGSRNEHRLRNLATALTRSFIPFVSVQETEGEYAGQLMAIGLVPMPKEYVGDMLRDFHMLRELVPPGA